MLPVERVDPTILEELLGNSRQEGDLEFIATMEPKPEQNQ